MTGREWTGSVARLDDAMVELAVEMANLGTPRDEPLDDERVRAWWRDHAYTLSEWAAAVRELYARLDEGEHVTNAQGVAMARLLRNARELRVNRIASSIEQERTGGSDPMLGFVQTYRDGTRIYGGIEPDGSVNA